MSVFQGYIDFVIFYCGLGFVLLLAICLYILRQWNTDAIRRLTESERLFRGIFEKNQAVMLLMNPVTFAIVDANIAACDFYGYKRDALLRLTLFDIDAAPREQIMAQRDRLTDGEGVTFVLSHRRASGDIRQVETHASLISMGRHVLIYYIIHDISERCHIEKTTAQEHDLLRTIINILPGRVFVKDVQHRFVMANQGTLDKMRLPSLDALIGRTDFDFYGPALAKRFRDEEEAILRTGKPILNKEDEWGSDKKEYSLTTKVPLRDNVTNAITGIVGIAMDITDRRVMEEALRINEEQFTQFVKYCPAAVYIKDADTHLLMVSRQFETIFGKPVRELLGKTDEELAEPELARRWREDDAKVLATGMPLETKEELGGRHYSTWKFPIFRQGKTTLLGGFFLDITDQKVLQDQLTQSQKMESVGRLAGGIAHDFNNLLQTILGFSEMLLAGMPERDDRRDDLAEIQRAARRAAMLTSQLLAFSRKQMIRAENVDINLLVEDAVKMLRRLIGEDIQLHLALADGLWQAKADPGQIGQVIMNLVVNARDAMPKGGRITITTSNMLLREQDVRVFPESQRGRYICLAVSDTGTGMAKEVLEHLFEPFFTTKGAGKGTGMGLAMVYGLVKQHGGWINVYSEIDQGSTFKMYLPAIEGAMEAAEESAGSKLQEANGEVRGKGEKILLVEDDAGVRALSILVLQTNGYTVFSAVDSISALSLFDREKGNFDLLFSDVVLHDMNGIELAETLLNKRPALKVLMTSGYTDERSRWPVIGERGWDFIRKPFASKDLLWSIRNILDRSA